MSNLTTEIVTNKLNVEQIREDFPILKRLMNGHELAFLDSAASSQKPNQVVAAITNYYQNHHANVHRGMYTLAAEATELFEATRSKVAQFIGAASTKEITFTRNATEAINLVAYSWGEENLKVGDEILISVMEHHANLVPWVRLCEETGAILRTIPIDAEGRLDLRTLDSLLNAKTKLVALSRMSNVLGTINDVAPIFAAANKLGAVTLVDAAQSAPHIATDVNELNCDFLVLSAHKMLGPTGVGILYGREELLNSMPPFLAGGEMIDQVSFDKVTYNELPHKFEAGTPNIAAVVAFSAAIDYLNNLGMDAVQRHEQEITSYALEKLEEFPWLRIYGPRDSKDRGAAVSFTIEGIHPHDVSQFLDSSGIAVRAGHHCAQPLMKALGIDATTRASFYIYNTNEEVDRLCEALVELRAFFKL
jgi:cysteine desulfurase / selenocysteine lyase